MFTKHTLKDSPQKFRKVHDISASNIKPFLSYAQKTTWGRGTKYKVKRISLVCFLSKKARTLHLSLVKSLSISVQMCGSPEKGVYLQKDIWSAAKEMVIHFASSDRDTLKSSLCATRLLLPVLLQAHTTFVVHRHWRLHARTTNSEAPFVNL